MRTTVDRYATAPDDWGARAVWWLQQRFVNWPIKAIARALNEPESVIKAWFDGTNRPSREKLQKLTRSFAKEGMPSFVFGAPSREEVTARLDTLNQNLVELRQLLNGVDDELARRRARRGRPGVRENEPVVREEGAPAARLAGGRK